MNMKNNDTATQLVKENDKKSKLTYLLGNFGIFIGLFLLLAIFAILSPIFLSIGNLRNILIQAGTNAIVAVGMTFVIISGEIDLSVGSVVALTSVIGARIMTNTGSALLGVIMIIAFGIILGLFNGSIVGYLGFPSFIVTLSALWLFRGAAYVYTQGQAIVGLPESFSRASQQFALRHSIHCVANCSRLHHRTHRTGKDYPRA